MAKYRGPVENTKPHADRFSVLFQVNGHSNRLHFHQSIEQRICEGGEASNQYEYNLYVHI